MKKFLTALLLLGLAAGLTACGQAEDSAQAGEPAENAEALTPEEIQAASEANAQAAVGEPPASPADAALDESAYETAQEYVGLSVDELYEVLGEPTGDTQYAASCDEENAEDGMLFYDGFYVWTVKTEEEETVRGVYLN